MMHTRRIALTAGVFLGLIACKDSTSVLDLNNVSAEALSGAYTPASNQLLVTGFLNNVRGDLSFTYIIFSQTLARNTYRLDNAESRFITETIGGPADFSGFVGVSSYGAIFTTVRAANTILNALPSATGLTPADVAGTRGLVNTFKALALYRVLQMRDSLGIPIDVNHPIDDPPAPFVCKPNVLAYLSALLDTAATDLGRAGAAFPFIMPFDATANGDFNTPAGILQVNRGLKGEIELFRGLDHQRPNTASFAAALTALNASFASTTAPMSRGIYFPYSTASNETSNPIADAALYLNPGVADSIEAGDKRASKIIVVATKTLNGVSSKYKSPLSDAAGFTAPIPLLKNSELLLLRAQVKIELGDLVGASADINAVRVADGGLAPIAVPATKAAAISAVLYEKRYSLLLEGAQRLVDLRAYNRLNATFLKRELPGDIFQAALPIPKSEYDIRNVTTITPGCP